MTDETNDKPDETGNLQGKVGYGKPPVANQFGGKKANPINRLGRKIRGKDALRKEWESIWSEIMLDDKGNPIIDEISQKGLTRLRAQMRAMTTSTNVRKVELAMAYTFGKPKEEVEVTGKNGEPLNPPPVDTDGFNRSISAFADAIREAVSGENPKPNGSMETPE